MLIKNALIPLMAIMNILLFGCSHTFDVDNIPDTLTFMEYKEGFISVQTEIKKGDPVYDTLFNIIQNNKTGWESDINTYAPSIYFKSSNVTINCLGDFVVINFKHKATNKWSQLSKPVPGCEAALISAAGNLIKLR
jgi:hypothetical protein